ncbi:ERAD-associated E3 ubiquitin-protein ligase HRD1-like isoform X1 [Zingiber officinale]|uniref:ERAD-associated E3 ubiquitin-protein ligase HRD1-like isoform X1 n=1 Tax=Zingiber officinale TaxID=94328 RepID=UPI001C4B25F4|nr:ERAD-associated E3 ubiquitin-protein ligase HRD1-like isoform X1 [Zingiber officinale]XP_042446755.1 ERAD-associated E3 ubiquitin-protein ligase HRD1-like isoform X1 [Zingiber officinale]
MMRLQTYAGFSFLATMSAIYYAFSSRGQFYPAMVYLSTSKICFVLLLNMGLVIMCIMWQLVKRLFLGSLREAEVERLNEQSWREVMDILFAITIFRQDFSVTFLAMVTALLLIKALHWLAQKRVEYIETTPSVSMLSHIRIISFMFFLLFIDCLFLHNSLRSLIQTRQASVALFFTFEYTILATTTVSTFVKYVFYVSDMLMEGQWERKVVYTFYLELVRDLLHLSLYIIFFLIIFVSYGIPLHLIRELYETFRSFKMRIADYVRYRKITSNMNERFPDATQDELNATDAICIICREEMITAKKLICGHLFHVHCLRSWLERQHTCPTCRALVAPPENGQAGSSRQHGVPQVPSQPVGSVTASSSQSPSGGTETAKLSRHQAVLQAAAMAASLYETSFTYCPPSSFLYASTNLKPPGYGSNYNDNAHSEAFSGRTMPPTGEAAASEQSICSERSSLGNLNLQGSLLRAQQDVLRSQIQLLQTQLQALQQQAHQSKPDNPDPKGKSIITFDLTVSKPDGAHQQDS